ncbi:unnamed protein product [Thelazia callipaeda]|uniref:PH domain-containing protein n=1 Tax=Thelazia callipaeda TaxID=103827 RepID=A0A158RD07_THECL|nr:unnamed protein product [Thelazia callipaeda]
MSSVEKKRASSSIEEETGVVRSGYITAALAPAKTKKTYYAVLGHRALELHESEKKAQKKNRHPRYLIDLSTCFNINRHTISLCLQYDGRLKYCVAVMTPDETLFLRAETDALSDEWFETLISTATLARALHLGRPVLSKEFFEYVWDITIVENLKLRKPVKPVEEIVNICSKNPSLIGPHRLCFYHHTIIVCRRGIEPASADNLPKSGIPPFKTTDYIEFPRQYMASFGCQERYFFMVMGRSSPSGACELWALCECEEVAADVHRKLNKIIEDECEKKRKMSYGALLYPSSYNAHRERLHTHTGVRRAGTVTAKKSTPDELMLKERRAQLRDYKWAAKSIQETLQEGSLSPNVPSIVWFDANSSRNRSLRNSRSVQNSMGGRVDRTRSFDTKIVVPSSPPSSSEAKNEKSSEVCYPLELSLDNLKQLKISQHRSSITSSSAAEETEDSGSTLRIETEETSYPTEPNVEDHITKEASPVLQRQCASCMESHKAIPVTNKQIDCDDHVERASLSATGSTSTNDDFLQTTPGEMSEGASVDNLEYAPMDMSSWSSGSASHLGLSLGEPQFNLEEVRSYVSDSSDSCYSSIAANGAPRAYSFGASHISQQWSGHLGKKPVHPDNSSPARDSKRCSATLSQGEDLCHRNKSSPSTSISQDDARKRAFSLGSSKSWFQKPFRKLSRDFISRAHRSSNTSQASSVSTTGLSLIHSPNSCFLPVTSQCFVASDQNATSHDFLSDNEGIVVISVNIVLFVTMAAFGTWEKMYMTSSFRSESIESTLSAPYSKRFVSNDHTGDHMPVDFGCAILSFGKSASSSLHSADSPSRSRTSSFGCGQRYYGVRDSGDAVIHTQEKGNESPSISTLRRLYERCREHCNSSVSVPNESDEDDDYVGRDPAETSSSDLHNSPKSGYEGQLTANGYSDSRNSQVFETIQESLSGRSSPASSKDIESAGSHNEWKVRSKVNLRAEKEFSEKETIRDNNNEKKQSESIDLISDSDYVHMDVSLIS